MCNQSLLRVLITTLSFVSVGMTASSDYKVGTWANFSKSAVTHTFDDGTKKQFSVAMPLFDTFGFKMTFATVTSGGMFPGWDVLIDAFNKGHEIASHSVTHVGTVNEDEMKKSQEMIRKNVPGEKCISMIYPFCQVPSDAAVKKYYEAGRVCGSGPEGPTPGNFIRIASLIVGEGGANTDLNAYADLAEKKNGWAVYLHHGVDGDHNWADTKSAALKEHLNYLAENSGKFWVETFGNVIRYIKERNNATITESSVVTNRITLKITDNLSDEIYRYPLTIRRSVPQEWWDDELDVFQGDREMQHSMITESSKKYIQFQAIPDGGDVVISNGGTPVRYGFTQTSNSGSNFVRFSHNECILYSGQFETTIMSVDFYNLNGQLLAKYTINTKHGSTSHIALTKEIRQAPFVLKISDGRALNLIMMVSPR